MFKNISIKLLVACSLLLFASTGQGQTVSEITNILNTKPQSISTSNVSANNNNLFSVDLSTSGYRTIGVQIFGTWSATVSFQGSNDNFTTTSDIAVYNPASIGPTWVVSTTSNATYVVPTLGFRYIRVRTTAYTSG